MSMAASLARLTRANKDLTRQWAVVRRQWRDAPAARFERDFLDPAMMDLRQAASAMEQMGAVISRAKRDCE